MAVSLSLQISDLALKTVAESQSSQMQMQIDGEWIDNDKEY